MEDLTMYALFLTKQRADEAEAKIVHNVRELVAQSWPFRLAENGDLLGINAGSGDVVLHGRTTRWAVPQQLPDARWAFPLPTEQAISPLPLASMMDGVAVDEVVSNEQFWHMRPPQPMP